MALAKYPIQIIIQAVDRFTAPVQRMNRFTRGIALPFQRLGGKLEALGRTAGIDKLGKSVGDVGRAFGGLFDFARRTLLGIGTWTVLGSASLLGMATAISRVGENIVETSRQLGVGSTFLQEWRFAATRSGLAAEDLDQGLFQLQKRLAEAATGEGESAEVLTALGIAATDVEGRLRPLEDIVPEIQERLAGLHSETLRNALAAKLFGREGQQLGLLLSRPREEMQGLIDRAHELGAILDGEALAASMEYADSWKDLQSTLGGVRNTLATAVLPVLTSIIEKLQAWLVGHRAQIQAFAEALARSLPDALRSIRDWLVALAKAVDPLVQAFGWLAERVGAVNLVLGTLAVVIGGKLVVAIAAVIKALMALNLTILGTPIGWILAGIAALVAAGYLLVRNWDTIAAFFTRIWGGIRDVVGSVATWISDKIQWLAGVVTAPFRAVLSFYLLVWSTIFETASKVVSGIHARVLWLADMVQKPFLAIGEFFAGVWDSIQEKVRSVIDWIMDKVRALTSWLPNWVKDKLGLTAPEEPQPAGNGQRTSDLVRSAILAPSARPTPLRSEAALRVEFVNAPPGTRVRTERNDGTELDLSMGYAMVQP